MAHAHFVNKARKANKDAGIKKGDSYYWWKCRFGGKHYSKTAPRPSQLTQSDFRSTTYAIREGIDFDLDFNDQQTAIDELTNAVDALRQLGEDQAAKLQNMPESLQQSSTGALLQSRADACEQVADEIESGIGDIEELEEDDETPLAERICDLIAGISWDFDR